MKTGKLVALLCLVGAAFNAHAGDTYKWQDEDGIWHFSDSPPAEGNDFDTIETPATPQSMIISRQAGTEREPEHLFLNRYAGPAQVRLEITEAENVESIPPLPATFTLPGQIEKRLVSFRGVDPMAGFKYRLAYQMVPGPPMDDIPDDLDYYPPFARGESYPITQGLDDANTHTGPASRYAVDIAMPIGTPVLAARGGIVMDFEDDFHGEGKQEQRYMPRANYVRILHDDGSMAIYAHLDANTARVRPGMRISRGRWIANSGNSGFSSGPHLHFVVQLNIGMAIESLPFRFRLPGGGVMDPDRPQVLQGVMAKPAP